MLQDVVGGDGRSTAAEPPPPDEHCVVVDRATGSEQLPAAAAADHGHRAWDGTTVYVAGDRVTSGGAVFEAAWRSLGRPPGASAHCPWQEIATTAGGTAVWTRSRIFEPGDVAVHDDVLYVAQWWIRGQEPGDPSGPWQVLR
ncbi:hypothetical protein [Cellulosimicrobium sp. NPDC057127]|uniref:hypothetical protein n=1 Tax=Cellulosimicrobium sp. NPDC057127 TaxID=3346026 RepID=UPI003641EA6D